MSTKADPDDIRWGIITVLRETEEPVLTTAEMADKLPISKRATQQWLNELLEDNKVKRKEVGSNAAVWWLGDVYVRDIPGINIEEGETIHHQWPFQLSLSECSILSSLDIPGDRSQLPARRRAVMEAYFLLQKQEEVSKRKFIDELYPEHQAGYGNENSWWERLIRKNLKNLPPVTKPQRGGKWKFDVDEDFLAGQTNIREKGGDPTPLDGRLEDKIDHPPDYKSLVHVVLSEWKSMLLARDERSKYNAGSQAIKALILKRKATKDELIDDMFHSESFEDEEVWWQECVQPAIEVAIDHGYIEYTHRGYVSHFPVPIEAD